MTSNFAKNDRHPPWHSPTPPHDPGRGGGGRAGGGGGGGGGGGLGGGGGGGGGGGVGRRGEVKWEMVWKGRMGGGERRRGGGCEWGV